MAYESYPGHNTDALTVFQGPYITLSFQDGPIQPYGENGTTNEEIIRLLIERLESLNGIMASPYNESALNNLQLALNALENRTRERQARGVEGTNQP